VIYLWTVWSVKVEERTRDCCNTLGWFVNSGEMPIEPGDSWFSAKIITVMHLILLLLGKALFYLRAE